MVSFSEVLLSMEKLQLKPGSAVTVVVVVLVSVSLPPQAESAIKEDIVHVQFDGFNYAKLKIWLIKSTMIEFMS